MKSEHSTTNGEINLELACPAGVVGLIVALNYCGRFKQLPLLVSYSEGGGTRCVRPVWRDCGGHSPPWGS